MVAHQGGIPAIAAGGRHGAERSCHTQGALLLRGGVRGAGRGSGPAAGPLHAARRAPSGLALPCWCGLRSRRSLANTGVEGLLCYGQV